jgi:hypothetical protein
MMRRREFGKKRLEWVKVEAKLKSQSPKLKTSSILQASKTSKAAEKRAALGFAIWSLVILLSFEL